MLLSNAALLPVYSRKHSNKLLKKKLVVSFMFFTGNHVTVLLVYNINTDLNHTQK